MTSVAGVVLAAGAGARMGGPKAEIEIDGDRLLDHCVQVLRAAGCLPVYAVVRGATLVRQAEAVVNDAPDRGLLSSLRLGVAAAGHADAIAVVLVDMPGITAADTRAVVQAWRPGRIAVARYADRAGHPIVMARDMWGSALAMAGPDDGARAYLGAHPDLIDEIGVGGSGADLDTPEELETWRRQRGR